MIGEVGHFALIWLAASSLMSTVCYAWQKWQLKRVPTSLSFIVGLNGVVATLSLLMLALLFVQDQFQYDYVASHSNSALPVYFKVAAVWGGHQGSMLFWVFTLSLCSALISRLSTSKESALTGYIEDVCWVMQLFVAAFAWFTLLASNPFVYASVLVEQGRDLNPMLQDIGLIFHPPLLYLGYIGFSTVFAFAFAALLQTPYNPAWIKLCLPWAILAWFFLTIGIVVGAWWAYNELGWGGWWFWDPVENASLLPWLTGSALLHVMLAARRQQQLMIWVVILALVTFNLSILGTFIVRSGILTSVHAFAVDPSKGIALLLILAVTLLVGFVLLMLRSDMIQSAPIQSLFGRGYLILLSLGLFLVATLTVLLGTFYPMLYEMIGLGQISVGTFIVRSGILTSVHAFAVDPSKGIALLLILAVTLLVGFVLLMLRSDMIQSAPIQSLFGRGYLILLSLGLFLVATLTVLLGTFYPMLYEMIGLGQISVGAPYFNTLFYPLSLIALLVMGAVPLLKWHHGSHLTPTQIISLASISLAAGASLYVLQVEAFSFAILLVWAGACWVIVTHSYFAMMQRKVTFMLLAHVGFAIGSIGAVMNAEHSYELNQKMSAGTVIEVGDWQVEYLESHWYIGANYTAQQGIIEFRRGNDHFIVKPERRHYPVRVMNMSEPSIKSVWNGDYYLTLGPKVSAQAYAVKIQFKAYVNWIWFGALLAAFGALIPLSARVVARYKARSAYGIIAQA